MTACIHNCVLLFFHAALATAKPKWEKHTENRQQQQPRNKMNMCTQCGEYNRACYCYFTIPRSNCFFVPFCSNSERISNTIHTVYTFISLCAILNAIAFYRIHFTVSHSFHFSRLLLFTAMIMGFGHCVKWRKTETNLRFFGLRVCMFIASSFNFFVIFLLLLLHSWRSQFFSL